MWNIGTGFAAAADNGMALLIVTIVALVASAVLRSIFGTVTHMDQDLDEEYYRNR